jgi:hypothetical protein
MRGRGRSHFARSSKCGVNSGASTPAMEGRMGRFCVWCGVVVPNQALHKSRKNLYLLIFVSLIIILVVIRIV